MTRTSTNKTEFAVENRDGNRLALNVALAGLVLLIVAGVAGWIAMGPALFHQMATGIGWLCM